MRNGLYRGYLAVGVFAVGAYLTAPDGLAKDIIYVCIGLSSAIAIVLGVRVHRPTSPTAWHLMAAGELSWVIGDAIDSWYRQIGFVAAGPSITDAFYLAAYPALGFALHLLIRDRLRGRDVGSLLDSAIVTAGLGLLSWVLLARPTFNDTSQSLAGRVVGVAYPAADILLFALLVRLVTTPGGRTAAFRMLSGAVALLVVGDTAYAYATAAGDSTSFLLDLAWLGSYLLWGAAALHPSMRSLTDRSLATERAFTNYRLAALTVATLVAPGTLAMQLALRFTPDGWAIVISSVLMFLLVVARMKRSLSQIATAVREREKLQDDLAYEAAHDSLTRLPNRTQAVRQIEAALFRAQRSGAMIGLLFIDLDNFKIVNDTFGHRSGDEVLCEVADRMQAEVRGGDMVARLGGDEFVVLLEPVASESVVLALAQRLVQAVCEPIHTSGREVSVGASVGVTVSVDGGTNADLLLGEADAAAYRAKSAGRGRVEIFDNALRRELSERASLEAAIMDGLPNGEFILHFQPVVHISTEEVTGYEALIRWMRPGFGLIPPSEFIPTAEASQLICELGRWVLHAATRQLARASDSIDCLAKAPTVSVNISGRHLASPRIVADVRAALESSGLSADRLVIEITETILIDDPTATQHLQALRDLGVTVSIDDFGTGYTSIGQLQHLPVDNVKIDRSFMTSSHPSAKELVRLMINAAHAFGLSVTAEGVEEMDQFETLRGMGCDNAQGFLLGRPLPAASIPALSRSTLARG